MMGFFASLLRLAKPAAKHSRTTKAKATKESASRKDARPTTQPPSFADERRTCCEELVLEGDEERTAYTYDGAPLKGTRKGSEFYVEVVTSPVYLYSKVTGSDWDGSAGGIALAYNGRPFGITNALSSTLREISAVGYRIRIKAKRVGMYCEGIPEIVLMIPEPDEIFLWRDACRALGREVPFSDRHCQECEDAAWLERERWRLSKATGINLPLGVEGDVIFVEDDKWTGDKPANRSVKVDISTELIPTPKGSSAKPHVLIRYGEEAFCELSARNRQHSTFLKHAGETPYLATCKKHARGDGTHCWQITVVYFSNRPCAGDAGERAGHKDPQTDKELIA